MATNDYVQRMREALSLTIPDLDTTIGTTTRKIIDVVAEVANEVSVDKYLLDYQYDIDTKSGADLDDFVRLFGFSRLPARRATGQIVFERQTPATEAILIPVGTQLGTSTTPTAIYSTVTPAVLMAGETSVTVAIQAVAAGSGGNTFPATIERFVTPVPGITSFSNILPASGGLDVEDDDRLRLRFKRTVFRNLAGTEQMFTAVALEHDSVSLANVIGSSRRRIEQVEVVGHVATATVKDAKYIYPGSESFGPNLAAGEYLTPEVHYSFDTTQNPPVVVVTDYDEAPDGIYDLEYDYMPASSRNDIDQGITNRIDIYVVGERSQEAIDVRKFSTDRVLNEIDGSDLFVGNLRRADTYGIHETPVAGNYFMGLSRSPFSVLPNVGQLVIGGTTYYHYDDFHLIYDKTSLGMAPKSPIGIEWVSVANGATKAVPADDTIFTFSYFFNAVPSEVEAMLRDWRLVTTDVWVHQAQYVRIKLNLAVVLNAGFTLGSVRPAITLALGEVVDDVGFAGVLQVSDILGAVNQVTGVDAVRFLSSADDATNYAIQRVVYNPLVAEDWFPVETYHSNGRAIDIYSGDNEYLSFTSLNLVQKAQNTIGET